MLNNMDMASIFAKYKQSIRPKLELNDNILIIDHLNTFIRCFVTSPATNSNGIHIGGMTGYLMSIGYAIKTLKPTRCIIVSDGQDSAYNKRKIYKNYKMGRKMKYKLNRTHDVGNAIEDERQLMLRQLTRLNEYFEYLPITYIIENLTEADDIIAYISNDVYPNSKITIMSTDKDYYQLINDRINVWSPIKKKIYNEKEILDEYGIHPYNFLLYRILDGDKSDNIDGVDGVGLKTIIKSYPFLNENVRYDIKDLFEYSEKSIQENSKKQIFKKVMDNKDVIYLNEKLMQLNHSNLSGTVKMDITNKLNGKLNELKKRDLLKLYTYDGLNHQINNFYSWIDNVFSALSVFVLKHNKDNNFNA